jgi:hypothetical protein
LHTLVRALNDKLQDPLKTDSADILTDVVIIQEVRDVPVLQLKGSSVILIAREVSMEKDTILKLDTTSSGTISLFLGKCSHGLSLQFDDSKQPEQLEHHANDKLDCNVCKEFIHSLSRSC